MQRFRNFAFLLYPESMPDNSFDVIESWKVPVFVSPLHDKDKKDGLDELKKPHYHVLIMFDGVKSIDKVKELVEPLKVVHVEVVDSKKGYARYLCHLDSANKVWYNPNEVRCFSGADYSFYSGDINRQSKNEIIREILKYVNNEGIYSYSEIVDYAFSENVKSWIQILTGKSAVVIKDYLKSKYWADYNMSNWRELRKARKVNIVLDEWHTLSKEQGSFFNPEYDKFIESHNLSFPNSCKDPSEDK